MNITIRKFEAKDIPLKVEWINNPLNNRYLHYNLPLKEDETYRWFERNQNRIDRYDATIEADGIAIGLIGLLDIDFQNYKAEYYITIGNREYLGKGIAFQASKLLLEYAFYELRLNRIFLFTEYNNTAAQRLFEKIGFKKEGLVQDDLFYKGRYVSRFLYGICKDDFARNVETPISFLGYNYNNYIYMKRDDLFPFSFGGNKARKAMLFWKDLKKQNADCLVTYGSSSSNHCRVMANIAASEGILCYIISPEEISHETYNRKMMEDLGAKMIFCKVEEVHDKIEFILAELRQEGYNPYFVQGGGHGNIGTQAYVDCYEEINRYEERNHICFDYIFHASGTGTTQAGLVCGKLLRNGKNKIVGISIARKYPYGRNIVKESVKEYLGEKITEKEIEENVIFDDSCIADGYGIGNGSIYEVIGMVMRQYGIPLDMTYTGKAFWGMKKYLIKNKIKNKKILFIHTGGTPLFFDDLGEY